MLKLTYSGLKYGEDETQEKLLVDIQNNELEIKHHEGMSQVMDKTTGNYIVVKRNTLKCEVEI